jgi:hypothetical protein
VTKQIKASRGIDNKSKNAIVRLIIESMKINKGLTVEVDPEIKNTILIHGAIPCRGIILITRGIAPG